MGLDGESEGRCFFDIWGLCPDEVRGEYISDG